MSYLPFLKQGPTLDGAEPHDLSVPMFLHLGLPLRPGPSFLLSPLPLLHCTTYQVSMETG